MLFAEIDAQGWVLIIGAVFFGTAQILTLVLSWIAKQSAAKAQEDTKQVKETQSDQAVKLAEIHTLANSMKDQLVKKTEEEALSRGGVEERARADARADVSHQEDIKQAVVDKALEIGKKIDVVPEKTARLVKEDKDAKGTV